MVSETRGGLVLCRFLRSSGTKNVHTKTEAASYHHVAASWVRTNYGVNVGISMSYQIILRPEMTKLKLPAIVIEAPRGGRVPRLDGIHTRTL